MYNFVSLAYATIEAHIGKGSARRKAGAFRRPVPTSMADAIAIFGSKKRLVQYALRSLDIEIQQKLRVAAEGKNGRRSTDLSDFTD